MSTNYERNYAKQIQSQPGGDVWHVPMSIKPEVKFLFKLITNHGETADEVRALIDVSPKDREQLDKLVAEQPALAGRVESALAYRERVRAEFDALLQKQQL